MLELRQDLVGEGGRVVGNGDFAALGCGFARPAGEAGDCDFVLATSCACLAATGLDFATDGDCGSRPAEARLAPGDCGAGPREAGFAAGGGVGFSAAGAAGGGDSTGGSKHVPMASRQALGPKASVYSCWACWMACMRVRPRQALSAACLGLSWPWAVAARVRASARARLDAEMYSPEKAGGYVATYALSSEALGFSARMIVAQIRIGCANHASATAVFERE